jgi:hypothetical protein
MFIIQIDLFNSDKKEWVTEKRFYDAPKDTTDFDLKPIEGKRRNIIFIGFVPNNIHRAYYHWCKETKRGGSVLVAGSIKEFFEYYKNYNHEI